MNFIMTGFMTWVTLKENKTMSLSGENNFVMDLIMTTFFFMFFTCLFTSRASRKAIRSKELPLIQWDSKTKLFINHQPSPFIGSLGIAFITTIIVTPILFGILILTENTTFSLCNYILLKSCYAALLAALLTPLVSLLSLSENSYDAPL
ncbi:hypothetical protein UJ101_00090 [Flavobacteriaceae bacterium UJ101]|nr:hypothetical protein UJ101_00090 [Flavobacteriaceae bacterium UJ101]